MLQRPKVENALSLLLFLLKYQFVNTKYSINKTPSWKPPQIHPIYNNTFKMYSLSAYLNLSNIKY